MLFCVVGLNGLGLNHHGGVAACEVLAFVGHDARHIARTQSQRDCQTGQQGGDGGGDDFINLCVVHKLET